MTMGLDDGRRLLNLRTAAITYAIYERRPAVVESTICRRNLLYHHRSGEDPQDRWSAVVESSICCVFYTITINPSRIHTIVDENLLDGSIIKSVIRIGLLETLPEMSNLNWAPTAYSFDHFLTVIYIAICKTVLGSVSDYCAHKLAIDPR